MIPFGTPMIDSHEKVAVVDVLSQPILVHGQKIKEFERKFCEYTRAPYAVAVTNCTAAMHLFWYSHIKPGDEVLCPAMTHVATANAIVLAGGVPVFVDSELKTGNMDPELIEEKITGNTRGIVVVHFLGTSADMGRIVEIAHRHNLFLLEDCAHALGTTYAGLHVGLHGDAGAFSFYPTKAITTAEGGVLVTTDKNIADEIRKSRGFYYKKTDKARPWIYDIPKVGFNYRMDELRAAVGVEQMKKANGILLKRRQNRKRLYDILLDVGIRTLPEHPLPYDSAYSLAILAGKRRDQILAELRNRGIEANVHYPAPVPYLKAYMDSGIYPNAYDIAQYSIALPCHPGLSFEKMDYIGETVVEVMDV